MACFIGVDVGSESVRAGVFDQDGRRLAFRVHRIQQFRPQADHVEQSSADIWSQCCAAIREALQMAAVAPGDLAAIGFDATCSLVAVGAAGQGVSVAADGAPGHDVIMWMDHRAVAEAAAINATGDPALAYVGGGVSVEMELPKVLWLKRHCPDRFQQVWRFFDLADYLVWRATGMDVASTCTLTCKWNYLAHESRFPEAMLAKVGLGGLLGRIPGRILPLGSAAGRLRQDVAERLGLTPDVTVATGIIDAHAGGLALVGAEPEGTLALIGGTSNCHMIVNRAPVMVPGVWGPYFGAMLPGWWLSEGGQSAAGALLDWTIGQGQAWLELQAEAKDTGSSVYTVLNRWVAALEEREPHPTRHLHVLPDHHGNRSPRAEPLARGDGVGPDPGNRAGRPGAGLPRDRPGPGLRDPPHHPGDECGRTRHPPDPDVRGRHPEPPPAARTRRRDRLRHPAGGGGGRRHPRRGRAGRRGQRHLRQDLRGRGAAWCARGRTMAARPGARAFHDAKYQVYLPV